MTEPSPEVVERAAKVEWVVLDVDGVLTDGRLYMGESGSEIKAFHARDGLGIRLGQRGGLHFGIISGRESTIVRDRARELHITEVHQGVTDKASRIEELIGRVGTEAGRVCFAGDDLVDLPAMRRVGLAVAPADAAPDVRDFAHYVTVASGGRGCVRETVDLLLRSRGNWDTVTGRFFRDE